jgi:hypothetical protein
MPPSIAANLSKRSERIVGAGPMKVDWQRVWWAWVRGSAFTGTGIAGLSLMCLVGLVRADDPEWPRAFLGMWLTAWFIYYVLP